MELDECLQTLQRSFNRTMRNVLFGDYQNIAKIDQSFYLLSSEITMKFQRYATDFTDVLTPNQLQAYTAVFTDIVKQERVKLQKVYSSYNLTYNREQQFQMLLKTIKLSLYEELQPVRKAVNSDINFESESCWTDSKPIICKMVEAVGVKIDEILKIESRLLQRAIVSITDATERSGRIAQSAYERCADENSAQSKQCVAFSVSFGSILFISLFMIFFYFSFSIFKVKESSERFTHALAQVSIHTKKLFKKFDDVATKKVADYLHRSLHELKAFLVIYVLKCIEN